MAKDRHNVRLKVTGQISTSALAAPKPAPSSGKPQYLIGITNPDFSDNDMQNPEVANAVEQAQKHVRTSDGYNEPNIFISLSAATLAGKPNKVRFFDLTDRKEVTLGNKEPARGQQVMVYIDTYDSDSNLTKDYGYRTMQLKFVFFPDFKNLQWFDPASIGIEGFETLDDQVAKGEISAAQLQANQNPAPNANIAPAGQNNQQGNANNAFSQPAQVKPAQTNPFTAPAGQNNQPANQFANAGQANTNGTQASQNTQPANPFANAGQTNANAAPAGQNTQPANSFANTGQANANGTQAGQNNQPANPFTNTGQANANGTQAGQNNQPANPFTNAGQTNASAAPAGQNTQPANPFANAGQTNANAAPASQNNQPANPFANAGQTNANAAPASQNNQPANPFTNAGQANANAAPTGQNTQPANPNGTQNGTQAGQNNQAVDPFSNATQVDISDDDLPF